MKKFTLLFIFCSIILLGGCKTGVNYNDYITERRYDFYHYQDDSTEIKIYRGERETPYGTDGYLGEVSALTEIFVTLPENPDEVEISVCGIEGEMNYRAAEKSFYLSSSEWTNEGDKAEITLTYGGKTQTYVAQSVLYNGVMSCEDALGCVIEHDKTLFDNLTENGAFKGEIFIRLLYDEGCYYYVGVCDRERQINAYLVDGVKGKIIATKQLQG